MAPTASPAALGHAEAHPIAEALNGLLADAFALFFKTKNFHWHVSGPHFRDYHLLFEEQAQQILMTTDPLAERVRKIGGTTLRSLDQAARMARIGGNDDDRVDTRAMVGELMEDNEAFALSLRTAHSLCAALEDVATASLIENWIDEAEGRAWFLREACGSAPANRR